MTIQSARPSSRSSQRSSGSIGSYGNRRPSSAPLHGSKGVLVSTSRTGAARSAAILLVSCHISALRNSRSTASSNSQHPSDYLSDDNMTKYLERQLEHQKQLLYLDIPSLRKHNKLLSKFCKTSKYASSNDDSSYDEENDTGLNHYSYENDSVEMGALPTPASEVANVAVKRTPSHLNFILLPPPTYKKHYYFPPSFHPVTTDRCRSFLFPVQLYTLITGTPPQISNGVNVYNIHIIYSLRSTVSYICVVRLLFHL